MIERLARVPVEVDYASEWRYRDPIIPPDTLTMLISQSGETADTIAAQREAKAKGSKTIAICNVVGSMITREAAGTIYTHAGPEIGVASTKAFTGQLTALCMYSPFISRKPAVNHEFTNRRKQPRSRNYCACPRNSSTCSRATKSAKPWPNSMSVPRTSCFLAAAFTIPSRSKARSSSKKFPTSTPKATPPAK